MKFIVLKTKDGELKGDICGIACRIDLERKIQPVTRFHRIGKETCAMYEQQQHVDK